MQLLATAHPLYSTHCEVFALSLRYDFLPLKFLVQARP